MRGLNNWRVALRIARRGARRTWGRSLLVVLLIGLPVLALAAGAVLLASTKSTLDERLHYTLGSAQAKLTVVGGPKDRIRQGVEGGYDYNASGDSSDPTRVDPRTVLPAGTKTITVATGALVFRGPHGDVSLAVQAGQSWNPALQGPYELLSGRFPGAADEVLLTPGALDRLGAHVGGTVAAGTKALKIVGTERDTSEPSSAQTVFGQAALLPAAAVTEDGTAYWVVDRPVAADLVARLNAEGTTAFSRAFVAHPSASAVRYDSGGGGGNVSIVIIVALALLFAVLEVALLAGSAFLVGARQQQRLLAVVASVGAERSVLRRVVTANGVVLGAIGGVLGVLGGVGAAVLLMRMTGNGSWNRFPGLHLSWPLLAAIAVFGVIVGWIAALVPARAAAEFDIVRALRGARTPQKIGKRPVVGVVLLAGGIVAVLLGGGVLLAAYHSSGDAENAGAIGAVALLGGGSVLAQVGVLLCAGLVLRGIARLLRRAPLATRLAARDTSRNLGRAVPAVASVMTTVFVAAFVMCIANTASIYSASQYFWNAPAPGLANVTIFGRDPNGPSATDAETTEAVLRRNLPVASAAPIGTTPQGADSDHPSGKAKDALAIVRFPERPDCSDAALVSATDLRCGAFTASGGRTTNAQQYVTVGPAAGLALLLGHAPSPEARAALELGGAVALRSDVATAGTAVLDWFTPKQLANGMPDSGIHPVRSTALATVTDLPAHPTQDSLYVTRATALRLGLTVKPDHVALSFTRTPTQVELDSADAALSALANSPGSTWVRVETGPQDYGLQIAWWVLLGCLVIAIAAGATAVGLARIDGRADDLTLAALGASRRVRRTTGAVQALIVCGVGAVIGTLLGLLPPIAIGQASASYAFAPPVLQLVLVALGIPLVIAAGAWLLVGRRGDLTRRTAIT